MRIQEQIYSAIRNHSRELGLIFNEKGYVSEIKHNLITPFDNWGIIKDEVGQGQGSELKKDNNGVVKFNALHSSTALCVNNFAPFKDHLNSFTLISYSNFEKGSFEKKLSTGISTPNLDLYFSNDIYELGIESKYTEIAKSKSPNINLEKYINRKELEYLPQEFNSVIKYYSQKDEKLFLNASQLIKHSIALINKGSKSKREPVLFYIYWLPTNWEHFEVYKKHKEEVKEFKNLIKPFINFHSTSYLEFWDQFQNHAIFQNHINKVKERYMFRI